MDKVRTVIERNKRYIWETHIRPLVTAEIVEEHRRDPFGHHSVELDMVLAFLRSDPLRTAPQYVVMCVRPEEEWVIGEHSRMRGRPIVAPPDAERYSSVEQVEHAIFLKRLEGLYGEDGSWAA
jgi:hypothetical protein